ncbi:MAG: hypothetical protein IIA82_08335 [Thaumarchaeota archaeon]|nr:hypothetical protein [Nitrososphaerota archaeon]
MIIRVNLNHEYFKKIKELVEKGDYEDEYDFINRAIKNQIQDEFGEARSPDILISQKSGDVIIETKSKFSTHDEPRFELVELRQRLNDIFSKQTFLKEIDVTPISQQEELYGPGTAGLIWIFHNRFFPVKFVLNELGNLMAVKKSNWVDLKELKERVSDVGFHISEKLYARKSTKDFIDLTIGLPATTQKLQERYKRVRHKEEKVNARIASSKKRFANQYVARIVKSKTEKETFSGACYEMGLITIQREGENKLNVTLTELGKEFVTMKNPILEELISPNISLDRIDQVFSSEETNFIADKIISQFELENIFIKKISENKGKELTIAKIRDIFRTEKTNFFKTHHTPKQLESLEKDYPGLDKTEILAEVVDNYFEVQSTVTMSRLMELGLVKRNLAGNISSYNIL